MNTPISQRLLKISLDELRDEFKALIQKEIKRFVRDAVTNERAIADLERKLKTVQDTNRVQKNEIERLCAMVAKDGRDKDKMGTEFAKKNRDMESKIRDLERQVFKY